MQKINRTYVELIKKFNGNILVYSLLQISLRDSPKAEQKLVVQIVAQRGSKSTYTEMRCAIRRIGNLIKKYEIGLHRNYFSFTETIADLP